MNIPTEMIHLCTLEQIIEKSSSIFLTFHSYLEGTKRSIKTKIWLKSVPPPIAMVSFLYNLCSVVMQIPWYYLNAERQSWMNQECIHLALPFNVWAWHYWQVLYIFLLKFIRINDSRYLRTLKLSRCLAWQIVYKLTGIYVLGITSHTRIWSVVCLLLRSYHYVLSWKASCMVSHLFLILYIGLALLSIWFVFFFFFTLNFCPTIVW